MNVQRTAGEYWDDCWVNRQILTREDCMDLPDTLKLLFLKWVRDPLFEPLFEQERYASFLTADITREGLLSMAAAMGGSELFDGLHKETEDCKAEEYTEPSHLFNKGSVNKASPAWNRPDFQKVRHEKYRLALVKEREKDKRNREVQRNRARDMKAGLKPKETP